MSGNLSPVTGVIEEQEVILDFGQYEGQRVSEIKTLDPVLYQFLAREKEADHVAIRRNIKDKTYRLYVNPLLLKVGNS